MERFNYYILSFIMQHVLSKIKKISKIEQKEKKKKKK